MKYRPEIDGLRAVAVIPVVLFHAGVPAFSGGYLGVDVFFVISGFLITSIIAAQVREGRFSLIRFYERRARRLMPALFVVMAAVWALAMALSLPVHRRLAGESLIAVCVYASNFLFWDRVDYFAPAAELNPLLHTWSLAVEEQFYLVFPMVLVLGIPLLGRRIRWVVVAVGLASFAVAHQMLGDDPEGAFFLAPSRAWELMAGAALALFPEAGRRLEHGQVAALGGIAVIAPFFLFDHATPTPSLWTAIPVLGTVFVLAAARSDTWVGRALAWRPLVHIGLLSYSLYLWHHPLYAFARQTSVGQPTTTTMVGLTGLAFLLAEASYWLVETPIRRNKALSRRLIFAGTLTGSLTMAAAGYWTMNLPHQVDDAWVQEALDAARWANPRRKRCFMRNGPATRPCRLGVRKQKPTTVLYGDSHADSFSPGLSERLSAAGEGGVQYAYSGCPAVLGLHRPDRGRAHDCVGFNNAALAAIRRKPVERVLVVSRWATLLDEVRYDAGNGCLEPGPVHHFELVDHPEVESTEMEARIVESLRILAATGKEIVVLGPVPVHGCHVPETLARLRARGGGTLTLDREVYEARAGWVRALLESVDAPNLHYVDPTEVLCDDRACYVERDGEILYSDDDHLGRAGADRVWPLIEATGVF